EQFWRLALDRSIQQDLPELEAMCLDNLGDLQLEQEQCLKAVAYYDQAIEVLLPGLTAAEAGTALRAASNKEHLLNYLTDRGKALFACYQQTGESTYLQQALTNYHQADELIDWMRYEHSARGSKLYWREVTRPMFEQALEVCFELQDLEQSFYFMEKSKAVLLLDAMRAHQARELIPEEVEQQEQVLQQQLAALRLEQLHAPEAEKEQWVDTILQVQQRLDQLVAQIQAANPVYAVMRYGGGSLTTQDVYARFVLPEQSGIVQYFMGSSQVYIWTMRSDGRMEFLRQDAQTINQDLQYYFAAMDKLSKAFYPDQYAEAAHRLYEDLFKAVDAFQDEPGVLIVPDGEIALLPFEALMRSSVFDPNQYLVQDLEIHYAYSMAVLNQQQRTLTKGKAVYTFAPLFEHG
ncbi:MAG: CHAT domain-containing protein, partial [Phaeodactylibacter sp.]|nr:CHAT domain-containing protein [Phaeodactylibacter sp.]